MRDDDLEHLSANYWITTVLCGLFLGIFLFMLQQHQRGLALYCIAALSLICAFFSLRLFPTIATHEKGTAKYSSSIE